MLRTDTRTHRCRSLPRDVAILRSSSVLGQAVVQSPAPLSTPFGRAPRRSMAIEHRFLRPSRVARLPHAASPPPGVDEEPYPGLPCSPCACASCCPRDPEVTPNRSRRMRGTSFLRRKCRPHVRGDGANEHLPRAVRWLTPCRTWARIPRDPRAAR